MTLDQPAAEPRTHEILDRVKAVFAAKGFDGASMQDLARAAGMSAGNFYRYFPSKAAIVEALIEREIAELRGHFAEVIRSPDPLTSFRSLVRERIGAKGAGKDAIWCEIEAAAARRPEAAALLGRMEGEIVQGLVAVFARIADLPEAEAERRFTAHARLILMLVQGLCTHCAGGAEQADRDVAALVDRVIEQILAEVAGSATHPLEVPQGAK